MPSGLMHKPSKALRNFPNNNYPLQQIISRKTKETSLTTSQFTVVETCHSIDVGCLIIATIVQVTPPVAKLRRLIGLCYASSDVHNTTKSARIYFVVHLTGQILQPFNGL